MKIVCDSKLSLGTMFDFLSDADTLKQTPAVIVAASPIMRTEASGSVSLVLI